MAISFPAERWLPKSVLCLRDYSFQKFLRDVIAGVTVGLVALPLAMVFSIASGLTPQAGIYCAIVTGFLISLRWTHAIRLYGAKKLEMSRISCVNPST